MKLENIDITERIGYDDCTFNEDEESYILFFFRFILCSNAMSSCFFNGYFGRNINCKFNLISLYRKKSRVQESRSNLVDTDTERSM